MGRLSPVSCPTTSSPACARIWPYASDAKELVKRFLAAFPDDEDSANDAVNTLLERITGADIRRMLFPLLQCAAEKGHAKVARAAGEAILSRQPLFRDEHTLAWFSRPEKLSARS